MTPTDWKSGAASLVQTATSGSGGLRITVQSPDASVVVSGEWVDAAVLLPSYPVGGGTFSGRITRDLWRW